MESQLTQLIDIIVKVLGSNIFGPDSMGTLLFWLSIAVLVDFTIRTADTLT